MVTDMEDKVEKRRAIISLVNGKPLLKLSRAYALFIPRLWLRIYGWELDGKVYVKVEHSGEQIIISPVDKEEALKMMEVNDATPK